MTQKWTGQVKLPDTVKVMTSYGAASSCCGVHVLGLYNPRTYGMTLPIFSRETWEAKSDEIIAGFTERALCCNGIVTIFCVLDTKTFTDPLEKLGFERGAVNGEFVTMIWKAGTGRIEE